MSEGQASEEEDDKQRGHVEGGRSHCSGGEFLGAGLGCVCMR